MSITSLKKHCLGPVELLAQSVAVISPTMTAALIVPVMFSYTGEWSWLPYALGTLMLLFTAINLNQFTKRSTSSGSMYSYIVMGLGMTPGAIGALALIWAYLGIATAGVTGFSIFADELAQMAGLHIPPILLFLFCAGLAGLLAWKDVNLSARSMLILEGASVALITILCIFALHTHGFAIDSAQFDVRTLPIGAIGLGVVVAVFSLVGFESASAFGDEARDPLRTIPRAIWLSLLMSGIFFVFVTYVEVQALHGYPKKLSDLTAPLNDIARLMNLGYLQAPISVGAMLSFFALCLSCLNAGARIIYTLGKHGIIYKGAAVAHAKNGTPHMAILVMAIIAFIVPLAMYLDGVTVLNIFGYAGTLAAFGFVVAYGLITAAAIFYLKGRKELTPKDFAIAIAAIGLLLVPAVGSIYPFQPAPVLYFPYIFLIYMAIGTTWLSSRHRRDPLIQEVVYKNIDAQHGQNASILVTAAVPID